MKPRSPVLGYNHNVRYAVRVWHVQTEDSGVQTPHIYTHLFHEGTILASKKTDYDPALDVAVVQKMMQQQHKSMLRELKAGAFDAKIEKYYGPIEREVDEAGEVIEMIADHTGEFPAMATDVRPPTDAELAPPPERPSRATPPAMPAVQPAAPAAKPLAPAPSAPRATQAAPPRSLAQPIAARPIAPPPRAPVPPPKSSAEDSRTTDPDLGSMIPPAVTKPQSPVVQSEEPRKKRPTLNPARPAVAVPVRHSSGVHPSPPPTIGSSRSNVPASQSSAGVPRSPPPTIGSNRSGSAGSATRIPAAGGVVVARPTVIVGNENAQTRGAADFWKTEPRAAPEPTFGENLISEKSLDEVILAYLSEDAPKK